jgi:hypothetical protein
VILLIGLFSPPLWAQMRMLRPVPHSLSSADRARLATEQSGLADKGRTICAAYAKYKLRCQAEGTPDSAVPSDCHASFSEISHALQVYNEAADKYNDEVVARLKHQVQILSGAVRQDQQAIRNLGLHNDADEFNSWSDWLDKADKERQQQVEAAFRDAARSAAQTMIEGAIHAGVNKAAALDPKTAERLIWRLRSAGADDPLFLDAIRKFAAARDKQQAADAGLKLLDRLSRAEAVWDLHDLGPDQESAAWQAGSDLFEIFIPDPKLQLIGKLTLDEVRATFYTINEAGIDFPVFWAEINSIEKLTERHLNDLKKLSVRLQADVQAKKQASAEIAAIDRQPAEGGCEQEPVAWELQTPHRHSRLSLPLSENVWNDKLAYEMFWGNLLLTSNTFF